MREPFSCRMCLSERLSYVFEVNGCRLYKCNVCDFRQIGEQPSSGELSQIYSESYFSHQKYQDQKTLDRENNRRINLIKRFGSRNCGAVLDVGCGAGDFMNFASAFYSMYGFDFSKEAIGIAKAKYPDLKNNLWEGSIDRMPDQSKIFDVLCMWDVFEHLWDPKDICQDLLKRLKDDGILILSTPKIDSLTGRLMRTKWHFMTPPEHLSFLTDKSIQKLAQSLDATIVYKNSLGKWVNIGFLLRKLKRKFSKLVPQFLVDRMSAGIFAKFSVYVPTGDILYLVLQKNKISD